jgi:protein disulfide-isomerase
MESQVFTQPSVAAAIGADYVPVKVNADNFPATARRYGVTALPATIIATPDGRPLETVQKRMDATQYISLLSRVAAAEKQRRAGIYAQIPGGSPPPSAPPAAGPPPAAAGTSDSRYPALSRDMLPPSPAGQPNVEGAAPLNRYPGFARDGQPPSGYAPPGSQPPSYPPPPVTAQPPAPAPVAPAYGAAAPPPGSQPASPAPAAATPPPAMNPPLGLDGYCPVSLCERQQWVAGDRRWGAIHRGRTYLFAGPEEQRRFFTDPDRYAPVVSGNDVVLATEQGQAVPGRREHGVFYENRVYLFSCEASLDRFARNPGAYASQALEALRSGAYPGRQLR